MFLLVPTCQMLENLKVKMLLLYHVDPMFQFKQLNKSLINLQGESQL